MSNFVLHNECGGGISRTIKANYWKMSPANFFARNGHAATFVIEYEDSVN